MEVLGRFPARYATNGKGKPGRGIGSHTDYGLLVMAAQDEVGGKHLPSRYTPLFVSILSHVGPIFVRTHVEGMY
jgi:isopenicillin N synthase-like dioxygenase